jgi:hypothetical protein
LEGKGKYKINWDIYTYRTVLEKKYKYDFEELYNGSPFDYLDEEE